MIIKGTNKHKAFDRKENKMFKVVDFRINPETNERDSEAIFTNLSQAEAQAKAQELSDGLNAIPDEWTHDVKVIDEEIDEIVFEAPRVYADVEAEAL